LNGSVSNNKMCNI